MSKFYRFLRYGWRHKYLWAIVIFVAVVGFLDPNSFSHRRVNQARIRELKSEISHYQQKFRELLELTYLKRFSDKSFKDDYKIDWDRVVKKKDSAIVSCFTQQKDVETEFEIILHAVDNRWQIYDTLVDGASLAKTYQKKYAKKLDERGIDGLLIDMQTEIDKLKKM